MTDFPPAWPKWLPLARKILAHPIYSGQRQYGAGGEAKAQLEHDERSLAKLLAREPFFTPDPHQPVPVVVGLCRVRCPHCNGEVPVQGLMPGV